MGNASTVDILLKTTADASGVEQTRSQYDELFDDLKKGVADALKGDGVDSQFISHVTDEFDRLNKELKETGASGDEVAEKIAKLEQELQAAAAAETKRIQQLKVNFEMALHEKDEQEEAAALQRRRREEDQLWMEQEGRRLQENTEKLEQEIMVRLKNERLAREATENTKQLGTAMQGTRRDIGGALLVGAQFVDDMQYGLRAVTGQIPQLAAVLGLGTGLAGVIGIAAVAVNLLWDKFGGAKEAKAETDKVSESLDAMRESLKRAGDASREAFQADLDQYVEDVHSATEAWQKLDGEISKVMNHHNEIAKLQNQIANSQLEIARQNALAGASTNDDKQAINAEYDARKAAINDASAIDQAQRNVEAQKLKEELLKKNFSRTSAAKDDAEGRVGSADRDQQSYGAKYGSLSDQGRQVQAYEEAVKQREAAMKRFAELNRPGATMESTGSYEGEYQELESKLEELHNAIAREAAGLDQARKALESGKGLSFDQLKSTADKAKTSTDEEERRGAQALEQALQNAANEQKRIDDELKASNEALKIATDNLTKLREEQADTARARQRSELALQAAEAKDSEDFAKAGTNKVTAEKEAAEKLRKKQIEEQAQKMENDAAEREGAGDLTGAAKLRNKAAKQRLPDDATPEQQRAAELEAQARLRKAREQQQKGGPEAVTDASSLIGPLSNLAQNLGPAGSELAKAVQQLQQGGATAKEMQLVVQHVQALAPIITKRFGDQSRQIAALEKAVASLASQLRSQKL